MRTAFVHIGIHTAIQNRCAASRQVLADQGIHYLGGDPNHGERLCLAFWEKDDALRLAGLAWKDDDAAMRHRTRIQAELEAEIKGTALDILVSAEELSRFRHREVERFLLFLYRHVDRVRVIGYLRDPLDWMTSAAQQGTKWEGRCLDDVFDAPPLPRYAARFDPWLRLLPRRDIDLRAYPLDSIMSDISSALGLATHMPPANWVNASASDRSTILYAHMNTCVPPFIEARHNPLRSFDLVRDAQLPGQSFTLPTETVEAVASALEAERDWAHAMLGRTVFQPTTAPSRSRDAWFRGERAELERLAEIFVAKARRAQNERALRMLLLAGRYRDDPARAHHMLDQAWLLTTDRWTLDMIAHEALEQDRGDREKFFAKLRLMRRIEAPTPDDPPLVIGNPFDRPWRDADDVASWHSTAA